MSIFDGLADTFTGVLGQPVTVTPSLGASRTITAMVVRRTIDDLGIIRTAPMVHARAVDVADIRDGDAVQIGAESFEARELRSDGRGMVTVVLESMNG